MEASIGLLWWFWPAKAVQRLGVAVSFVVKWTQRYRSTGPVAPGKMSGHHKPVLELHRAFSWTISGLSRPPRSGRSSGAAGAQLFFLPPSSLDLSPIEQVFSKIRH